MVERELIQLSIDLIQSFSNWLRTSCVVSMTTASTWNTRTANFCMGWLRTTYRRSNKWAAKMIVSLCQGWKTALRTLVVTFDTAHCFDRNTICLKDLTFLFIMQHQTCMTRMTIAMLGFSWWTAVKTIVLILYIYYEIVYTRYTIKRKWKKDKEKMKHKIKTFKTTLNYYTSEYS